MCSHTILKNSMDKRNKPGLNYDGSFSKIRRHLLRWREPYEKDCCKGSLSCAGTFIIWLRNECAKLGCPDANYKEGYTAGYEAGYHDGKQQAAGNEKRFAQFSGSFTATVEQLLPDYYALPGKTIAVVHFFQDRPFLLHFQKDLTGELLEGTSYVFEFEPFEVELSEDEENPDISDYMYSINVTGYRVAEDDELGSDSKMPTVEIVSR